MSRPPAPDPSFVPLIALVHRANRALQSDMVREANRRGYPEIKQAYNWVFATLDANGSRAIDMAAQAGITRQSMGEVIREMVDLGFVEMQPDPSDRRAKLVTWTRKGLDAGQQGYEHILEVEERFAQEFGDAEYEQARAILARITSMLEEPE
jgi:DNA-binding MarR family transcriptional regulator